MTEIIIRYVKLALYFVVAWVLIWVWNTYNFPKVEGKEMEPFIPRDSFKVTLPKVRQRRSRCQRRIYTWVRSRICTEPSSTGNPAT